MKNFNLSVAIVAYNEENNLPRCLDSVKSIADEFIVVDSFSTDKTPQIVRQYGAKLYFEKWRGNIGQKNFALDKCTNDWILSLDADEEVSDRLRTEIIKVLKNDRSDYDGFAFSRRVYYLGKWINFAWYPDWKVRLVRKDKARWTGYDPHDVLEVFSKKVLRIPGDLHHYSYKDFSDHLERTIKYSRIVATEYQRLGRKVYWYNLVFNPVFSFIKHYFIKLGFLDGIQGLLISVSAFLSVLAKYIFLWEMEKNKD